MKLLTILLAICFLSSATAHAEDIEYDFELIIFEDLSGRYEKSELWQHELFTSTNEQAVSAAPNNSTISDIKPIKGIGLQNYAKKLNANKRYNVLFHKAWRQTGLTNETAIEIPIDSRSSITRSGHSRDQNDDENSIHGSIKILLGRYLHIYTDMIYQKPGDDTEQVFQDQFSQHNNKYLIKSHRRMRSKELHYLDHPMVGMLVMAMPVEE